jgi:hypothetical protein
VAIPRAIVGVILNCLKGQAAKVQIEKKRETQAREEHKIFTLWFNGFTEQVKPPMYFQIWVLECSLIFTENIIFTVPLS